MLRRLRERLRRAAPAPSPGAARVIPDRESAVRRLMADASAEEYVAFESLAAAREDPAAALVMEGDWGGQIYLGCPLRVVAADEVALRRLLLDLDAIAWPSNRGDGAALHLERLAEGEGVFGGMGGGLVSAHVWVHEEFVELGIDGAIRDVVHGRRERLAPRGGS